jgi:hypothetical protein
MLFERRFFQAGEGKYLVVMEVAITGEGLVAQIFGGEKPHVGAVALSVPRPGLDDPEKVSCNTTVVPLLGHKDDEIAKPAAEEIVKVWGSPVVVVAGVHIDNAGREDLEVLIKNCREVTRLLIQDLLHMKERSHIF